MSEESPTYDFDFVTENKTDAVKSVLRGYKEAVQKTHWNLTKLTIHPDDAAKLRVEMEVAPLPFIQINEDSSMKVGTARLSVNS